MSTSSFFTASEADMETCFSEVMRNPRGAATYLSLMVFFLIVVLCTDQLAPYNFLLWLALAVCLLAALFKVFPCRLCRDEPPPVSAGSDDERREEEEQQVRVPPFATREQLPDIRIQLALLEREFDERDYDALRALDADVVPDAMTQEQINALPVYVFGFEPRPTFGYVVNSGRSSEQQASTTPLIGNENLSEDIVECRVCLEEANEGEHIRRLPCSHQFHASCIYPWLQRQGTCPICKCKAGCAQQDTGV